MQHVSRKSGSSVMSQNAFNQSDCRILWSSISRKRVNSYLSFFHGVCHCVRVAFDTTFFGWLWPVVPHPQIAGCFGHQYLWKESIEILLFFIKGTIREGSIWDYFFWFGLVMCVFCPFRLQDSLIISISRRNPSE